MDVDGRPSWQTSTALTSSADDQFCSGSGPGSFLYVQKMGMFLKHIVDWLTINDLNHGHGVVVPKKVTTSPLIASPRIMVNLTGALRRCPLPQALSAAG